MKMNMNEKIEIAKNIIIQHMEETNPKGTISIIDESDGFNVWVNTGFMVFVCYFDGVKGVCDFNDGIHDFRRLVNQLRLVGLKVKRT